MTSTASRTAAASAARRLGREHAALSRANRTTILPADLDWLIRQARKPRVVLPIVTMPCELVLTGSGRNSNVLVVRCRCMAGTRKEPKARYYAYDTLGETADLAEALRIWREHRDGRP